MTNGAGKKHSNFEPIHPTDALLSVGSYCVPISRRDLRRDKSGKRVGFTVAGFVNTDSLPPYLARGEPYLAIPGSSADNIRLLFSHLRKVSKRTHFFTASIATKISFVFCVTLCFLQDQRFLRRLLSPWELKMSW